SAGRLPVTSRSIMAGPSTKTSTSWCGKRMRWMLAASRALSSTIQSVSRPWFLIAPPGGARAAPPARRARRAAPRRPPPPRPPPPAGDGEAPAGRLGPEEGRAAGGPERPRARGPVAAHAGHAHAQHIRARGAGEEGVPRGAVQRVARLGVGGGREAVGLA